jgi:hypothetical protein
LAKSLTPIGALRESICSLYVLLNDIGLHEPAVGCGIGIAIASVADNTAIPYAFTNIRTVAYRLAETTLWPRSIRAPERLQNTFANETFIDEPRYSGRRQTIQFRMDALTDPRGLAVLHRLASAAQWHGDHPTRTNLRAPE